MADPGQRYASIDDLPVIAPVFPLTGTILLPRRELPLNIFEPRYLAMVDASLAGERVIGMVQPAYEDEDLTPEPITLPPRRHATLGNSVPQWSRDPRHSAWAVGREATGESCPRRALGPSGTRG